MRTRRQCRCCLLHPSHVDLCLQKEREEGFSSLTIGVGALARYSTARPKPDQSPYESEQCKLASCTGLSVTETERPFLAGPHFSCGALLLNPTVHF